MNFAEPNLPVVSPEVPGPEQFTDARAAVKRLQSLYGTAVDFLRDRFTETLTGGRPAARFRAFYPEIRLTTTSFDLVDSRLSFGYVGAPGTYSTTITRPELFENYLIQQVRLLIENHRVPVTIGPSETPMPVHFAVANDAGVTVPQEG
jgi:AMP nucleosidase